MSRRQNSKRKKSNKTDNWSSVFLILCSIISVYIYSVFTNDFVRYDDNLHIYENPVFLGNSTEGLLYFWKTTYMGLFIPVYYSVLGLWATIFSPQNSVAFHFLSLIFHCFNSILIYRFFTKCLHRTNTSLISALIFALHPIQVEAISWATSFKDVLSGFFALLILNIFIRQSKSLKSKWICGVLFLLAILSKPSFVVLPVVMFFLWTLVMKQNWRQYLSQWWFLFAACIPVIWITKISQPSSMQLFPSSFWQRPILMFDSFGFYIYKFLAPFHFNIDYGRSPGVFGPQTYMVAGLVVALICLALVALRFKKYLEIPQGRLVLFFLISAFILLLPTSGLVPFVYQWISTVSDRYAYLSVACFSFVLVEFGFLLIGHKKTLFVGVFSVILLALGIQSHLQTKQWKDSETLFQTAVQKNNNSYTHFTNLGDLRAKHLKRPKEAIGYYQKAIEIHPSYPPANIALGNIYLSEKKMAKAREQYERILIKYPQDRMSKMNIGLSYFRENNFAKAMEYFEMANISDPQKSPSTIDQSRILSAIQELKSKIKN